MTSPAMLRSGEDHELVCVRLMEVLDAASVPFLVGGAFAQAYYTEEPRLTKDLDIMLQGQDIPRALDALAAAGFDTALPYPHWLAKATHGDFLVDLIFASGNGIARVDDEWFGHARQAELFGRPVRVTPVEELVWSKAFVMERERYDGADVAHLFWSRGRTLDWNRLERRFGPFLPVLYMHLVAFLFVFSDGHDRLPAGAFDRVQSRALTMLRQRPDRLVCKGTLVSREQYLHDLEQHRYSDGRTALGTMSSGDIEIWTAAIADRD